MTGTKDITDITDIREMVNAFYGKVRADELIGPIFNNVIKDNWDEHLEKMYRFWQTVLLKEHTYYGNPFPPHAQLPVSNAHFSRWKAIFVETVDERFAGPIADDAKRRAEQMALMFEMKIKYYQNSQSKPLI